MSPTEQELEPITRQIRPGIYRNEQGAEVEVTDLGIGSRPQRLGDIWNARSVNPLFGPEPLLVTTEGLISCGYQRVVTDKYPNNPDIGPRCGECRLGLGVHNTSDPYCDHHITNSGEPHEDQ